MKPSPWWYRHRGLVICAIYVGGFFFGYASQEQEPVSVAWGSNFDGGKGIYVLLWLAVASAFVAWLLRASGTAYLDRGVVFASDVQSDRLIVSGPFRYVRNPLYLGNLFFALAIAILAPPLGFVIILVGNVVVGTLLAREESRTMAAQYGPAYDAYRTAVPAFVPRLTAATIPGAATVEPSWAPALLGEAFCLALALAIVPLALYRSAGITAFSAICIPTFVAFSIAGWLAGRRRPTA